MESSDSHASPTQQLACREQGETEVALRIDPSTIHREIGDAQWVGSLTRDARTSAWRLTIALVDPQGTGTLVGRAPMDDGVVGESVAVAPDAVYFSTQNQRTFTWEIDRIAR